MAGHSQLRHGARAAANAYNSNKLDKRCGWVRKFLGNRAEMLIARGLTDATIDVDRQSLIDRIAFKRVQVDMHQRAALKEMQAGKPAELPANFFKLSETLRRDELALAALDKAKTRGARAKGRDWTVEDDETDGDAATH